MRRALHDALTGTGEENMNDVLFEFFQTGFLHYTAGLGMNAERAGNTTNVLVHETSQIVKSSIFCLRRYGYINTGPIPAQLAVHILDMQIQGIVRVQCGR